MCFILKKTDTCFLGSEIENLTFVKLIKKYVHQNNLSTRIRLNYCRKTINQPCHKKQILYGFLNEKLKISLCDWQPCNRKEM